MGYLKFDKSLLINLEKSLTKQMLRTNKKGAYSVTTITDCNTSKYDGLLVAPLPELDGENYVLLSSLDETVIQHGAEFNMGIHKFNGDNYSPKGHKYIREFKIDTVACTTYRVGGVIFSKERVFITDENRILIKYTMIESQTPVKMRFKPLLAFRNVNELTHENNQVDKTVKPISNGIATRLYPKFPYLSMQWNKKNEFIEMPDWYRGIEYPKEQERGYAYKEDLYTPGYFELTIKKGESVIFSAGITEGKPTQLNKLYNEEIARRTSRLDFYNCLKNAGKQCRNLDDKDCYIMAGYPWFKCRARDEFIALPGIALATDNMSIFYPTMDTAIEAISEFMQTKKTTKKITEIEAPDVLLWWIWCIQQYALKTSIKETNSRYGDKIMEVIKFIQKGKHPNLELHENGLLYSNGYEQPISWMNGVVWGRPSTPRTGYLVEINALWYNALKFAVEIATERQSSYDVDLLTYQAEFAKETFLRTFWNGDYLYDYVSGMGRNHEVRPNMIFAVSLPYSTLDKMQQKKVVDIVTRELLTPRGLRSLSPKSGLYHSSFEGNEIDRNTNYHKGTAWPWLMGAFTEAYLRVYKQSGLSFLERNISGFEAEMNNACIGTINELFDGNPPYKERGAMSFAMSIGEVLRALTLIKNYDTNL